MGKFSCCCITYIECREKSMVRVTLDFQMPEEVSGTCRSERSGREKENASIQNFFAADY